MLQVPPVEENALVAQKQPEGWLIDLKNDHVERLCLDKKQMDRDPANGHFEGQHLFFSRINGQVNELRFAHDSLQATLRLSAPKGADSELKISLSRFPLHRVSWNSGTLTWKPPEAG